MLWFADPRHWIAVRLDADMPVAEIRTLATDSYNLVCAGLTRKQRAELAGLSESPRRRGPA